MTSDEQNVAQVGAELLEASGNFTGYQIAVAESDADLTLPAVVVTARHDEDTQIMFNGAETKRYALSVEVRGIQSQDAVSSLDAAFDAVDVALHPSTPQTVPSGSLFQGIMIDVQTASESDLIGDARVRRRVYDVFAVEAVIPPIELALTFKASDVNVAQDKFTKNGHGLANDTEILFRHALASVLPAPLVENTLYYVTGATSNSFQVSLEVAGAAVELTDSGTGTNLVYRVS